MSTKRYKNKTLGPYGVEIVGMKPTVVLNTCNRLSIADLHNKERKDLSLFRTFFFLLEKSIFLTQNTLCGYFPYILYIATYFNFSHLNGKSQVLTACILHTDFLVSPFISTCIC